MIKWLEEYLDFFLYPALLMFLLWLDRSAIGPLWAAQFAAGWVVWTFAEYWIHRSVLHGFYWMGIHQRHHEHPRELTRFPLWQVPSYFAIIFGAVYLVNWWTPSAVVPAYAGVILGWIMFFVMHHVMHHAPWLVERFSIRHNAHHRLTDMNYGITVDWWDRVFRTYRQPKVRT